MGRWIILQTIGAGLLVAAYLLGILPILLNADNLYAIPIIGGLTLVGLGNIGYAALLRASYHLPIAKQDRATSLTEGALWLADKLPVVGLALTVTGLLWASAGDLEGFGFKRDILNALVGNLMGVVGYAWLELTARVCR